MIECSATDDTKVRRIGKITVRCIWFRIDQNPDENGFVEEYDPSNPDADENGYVSYPNVNIVTEMTNLIDASRAYEANVTAFDASKQIAQAGLQIGKL